PIPARHVVRERGRPTTEQQHAGAIGIGGHRSVEATEPDLPIVHVVPSQLHVSKSSDEALGSIVAPYPPTSSTRFAIGSKAISICCIAGGLDVGWRSLHPFAFQTHVSPNGCPAA